MPTIYTHPMSTFAQRIHIALAEKGLRWPTQVVALEKGAHREESYLRINPYGRVPAMVDEANNLTLVESSAILEYIEASHPEPSLCPQNPADRAKVTMHIKLCDLQLARHLGTLLFPKRFLPQDRWPPMEEMRKASQAIDKHFTILNGYLEGQDWLVANRYTLADLAYAPLLQFVPLFEVTLPPGVHSWAQRLLSREAVKETKLPDAMDLPSQ